MSSIKVFLYPDDRATPRRLLTTSDITWDQFREAVEEKMGKKHRGSDSEIKLIKIKGNEMVTEEDWPFRGDAPITVHLKTIEVLCGKMYMCSFTSYHIFLGVLN